MLVSKSISFLLIKLFRFYQVALSPYLGARCRFYPSCSEYACLCLCQYGLLKALKLIIRRLSRCHPFGGSGFDPP